MKPSTRGKLRRSPATPCSRPSPIFRAHPLLVQTTLALAFNIDGSDTVARLTATIIGVATIVLVYMLGSLLYGRRVGLVAALFMAVMPYHVIVTRQFLLDGPLTLLTTLTLYCLARWKGIGTHGCTRRARSWGSPSCRRRRPSCSSLPPTRSSRWSPNSSSGSAISRSRC